MEGLNTEFTPVIAVVGRPNVGKSTLVNILSKKGAALTADIPGTTRDRIFVDAMIGGKKVILVDTGGFIVDAKDEIDEKIMEQLKIAVEESDIIICLFDSSTSPTLLDKEISQFLRKTGKKIIYAGNKCDRKNSNLHLMEYYELGIDDLIPISATHKIGLSIVEDKVLDIISEIQPGGANKLEVAPHPAEAKVLVMGRPNSGKSTLINTIVGKSRLIVSSTPGTTRDCVEIPAKIMNRDIILIDSAGIRRPRSINSYMEEITVLHAIEAISGVDIALILVDSLEGIVGQDERLMSLVLRKGKGLVIGFNKWDLMKNVNYRQYVKKFPCLSEFFPFVPAVPLSGLSGWNLEKLFSVIWQVIENHQRKVQTAVLNRIVQKIISVFEPPRIKGKQIKIYFASQTDVKPPVFSLTTNMPGEISENWKRFLINELRKNFKFNGVPIIIKCRHKRERAKL